MITHQFALIKREIWEHRSIWITPAAVAFVVTFIAMAMVIMVAAFGEALNPEIEKIADATLPDPFGGRRLLFSCSAILPFLYLPCGS